MLRIYLFIYRMLSVIQVMIRSLILNYKLAGYRLALVETEDVTLTLLNCFSFNKQYGFTS